MKILNKTYPKDNKLSYIQKLINEELNIKVKKPTKIVISESKFKKIIEEELNAKLKKPTKIVISESKLKKIIKEEIQGLVESRKTEGLAMNALTKHNIPNADNILNQFKEIDKTRNQILLPALAKAYIEHPHIDDLRGVFEYVGEEINNNRIRNFVASKKGYTMDQEQFRDWLSFSEHIHGLQAANVTDVDDTADVEVEGEEAEWENEKISVYDGRTKQKCIKYGAGGISGKKYQFCIGTPPAAMHQSYRDQKMSTFWYVFDKTKDLNDNLHMVVVDAVNPEYAQQQGYNAPYELTDAANSTGNISQFGKDVKGYIDYLKSQGVPVEQLLKHEPHTEEEQIALQLLKKQNPSLDWFKNIGAEAQKLGFGADKELPKLNYALQSQYIGRGHRLSDEQFNYLWPLRKQGGAFNLLKQYVGTGIALPESQFNILVGESQ